MDIFVGLGNLVLCSSNISVSMAMPAQAERMFVMHRCCLNRALITGVPGGTTGAFSRYERMDRTDSNDWY